MCEREAKFTSEKEVNSVGIYPSGFAVQSVQRNKSGV